MPKISIIVPVYNVEKYLEKCVRSILAQTFTDFELILVDDGSPDSSGAMCDQFAKQDERVKVIHKENGGLSDARNAGIEIATGEYLGFIDSDDYIADDMYELLYTNIVKEDADLSICGIYDVYEGKEPVEKQQQYIVLDKVAAMKMILEAKVVSVHAMNKLYKKEIFEDIRYPVGMITEDGAVILSILEHTEKIVIDTQQKYYYFHRANSISTNLFSKKDLDTINVWKENEKYILDRYPELSNVVHTRVCWANFIVLDKMVTSQLTEEEKIIQKEVISFLRKNFLFIMKNKYFTKARKIAMCALQFSKCAYSCFPKLQEANNKKNS
ncbi:glycosyltransferase family 2 protein [Enterococcus faecalis]|uniref:glycosyltransferase family 2 protein n=1 Tax=Enterococcus faecalis TaxID=1351 RepID=UPI003D34E818